MGLATDAIQDLIAPAPRAVEPAPAKDDQPSFDDHVQDAAKERPERPERALRPDRRERPERPERPERAEREELLAKKRSADEPEIDVSAISVKPASITEQTAPTNLIDILGVLAAAPAGDACEQVAPPAPEAPPATPNLPALAPIEATPTADVAAPTQKPSIKAASAPAKTGGPEKAHPTPAASSQAPAPQDGPVLAEAPPMSAPAPQSQPALDPTLTATDAALLAPSAQAPPTQPERAPKIELADVKASERANAAPKTQQTRKLSASALAAAKESFAALISLASGDAGAPAPTSPTHNAGLALAAPTAEATPIAAARAAPVAMQIGREIIRRSNGGATRFEMRLDPPELGRVEVRLEISREHRVTAVISADNPQALHELSRGARDLEQALQSAGLELAEDGLSFDLSDSQNQFTQADERENRSANAEASAAPPETLIASRRIGLESWRGVRVDVIA